MTSAIGRETEISSQSVDAGELPEYYSFIKNIWNHDPCGPKAEVERFLEEHALFFPSTLVIPRSILPADNPELIREKLLTGIDRGNFMGVRSVSRKALFGGEKLPWVMELNTAQNVDDFLQKTLPQWQNEAILCDYDISQLIIMSNPPDIGTKKEQANQFVLRISWDDFVFLNSPNSKLTMELALATNQLRGLDRRMVSEPEKLIRYQCLYTPAHFPVKNTEQLLIGSFYTNPDDTDKITSILSKIKQYMHDPNIQLLKRLEFFADLNLNMIEIQGLIQERTGIIRPYIYGLRGSLDETKTGLHPNESYETDVHPYDKKRCLF